MPNRLDLTVALAELPVNSAAAAVIGPEGIINISDTGERYNWASVTKIVSACTILDACLEGLVSLNDPLGPDGSTLGHLLAHTSGYTFNSTKTIAKPGTQRVYSNINTDVAAQHLAEVTGTSFTEHVHDRVLDLLDMDSARLEGPASRGMTSTISDLAALAVELLAPKLLLPEVVRLASTPTYPDLGGVLPGFGRQRPNLWGYGCEIRGHKTPHWTAPGNSPSTFGHFGMSGSFCWIDPDAQLGCVFLCDRDFGTWASDSWPSFSQKVLDAYL
ncbi:serine hydrolase domain-containing protein [Dermatophilus congolensis]|uniref:serine hydrolase domain-containing protein n=1 Tax=Dermatophilus congolensis TaxID=1863 RepID=UPI001AAF14C1|nr:serine hydrolase domain-containing protein [Dermatophilus congolensis]MBO3143664.1 beta-lactamase family protein [Dermatophilus congolensis]MBO3152656.1 beta-lactamase family protein [Dermatophilus congolensis]MBO3160334.1 beta-lactamase family protein [Dermatophilus congolensis]MBO3163940.1 beta-lactamase family protein [Dermatophilus congolensis]MBO3177486.1 beta-lactamase family protein [Dermatophilus congolensis]